MDLDGNGANTMDLIGYSVLVDSAMKAVMREALKKVQAANSLPGDHHFYITFRTDVPGVQMADALKDRFPEEITIVIQHQFWDLSVTEQKFEITLKFGGVPQSLVVPFSAVTRFSDPSVNLMIPFAGEDTGENPMDIHDHDVEESDDGDSDESTVVSLDAFRRNK